MAFNDLIKIQQSLGEEIQSVVRNFKKDSPERKVTSDYFQERLRRISQAWDKFEQTDTKIRTLNDLPLEHDYFSKDYYAQIIEVVETYTRIFEESASKIDAANSDKLSVTTDGAALMQRTPTTDVDDCRKTKSIQKEAAVLQAVSKTRPDGVDQQHKGLIRKFIAQISALKRHLVNIESPQQEHSRISMELKLKNIKQRWSQIEHDNYEIWQQMEDPSSKGYDSAMFIELEEEVHQKLISLSEDLENYQRVIPDTATQVNMPSLQGALPLPKVVLQKFDGDYLKWRQFFDLFNQMIHSQALPNVQKMWYLKTNVTGEAEKLIRHLSLSEANYTTAWKLLQDRYNNHRVLTNTLVSKLLDQPTLSVASAKTIKELHDTTHECLLALENLGVETNSWDPLLLPILIKKLDRDTHILYEQTIANHKEIPKLNEFLTFLEAQFQTMEAIGIKQRPIRVLTTTVGQKCKFCHETEHLLFTCAKFLKASVKDRLNHVIKNRLCMNCLRIGHNAFNCRSRSCSRCQKKHNTLLHQETTASPIGQQNSKPPVTLTTCHNIQKKGYVLLSTALINVTASNGKMLQCRVLLDSGSQINIITSRLAKRLGISGQTTSMSIEGIGRKGQVSTQRAYLSIQSRINGYQKPLEAYVLPQITTMQPSQSLDISSWSIPKNIELADPHFNQAANIDILLGAELYHQLLTIGQIKLSNDLPLLQNTVFGWIFSGKVGDSYLSNPNEFPTTCGICTESEEDLDKMIQRLWQMDDPEPKNSKLTMAEELCETHFLNNTQRDSTGRFIVRLPFQQDPEQLKDSETIAMTRFFSLEKRLSKDQGLREQYVKFMNEYEELGHMEQILANNVSAPHYVIPHHCVLKPDSSSTKLRVVFDASCKTSSGLSLNDILFTGPTIQCELFSILLRFRLPRFVFCTDIQKMYRQISVHPADRKYQVILWRNHPGEPVRHYQLNTVTYGTRSAPFLATRCLQQLAEENNEKFELGAQVLKNNFYVDDCLSGSDKLSTVLEMQCQLKRILEPVGFKLRKWCANHPQILQDIDKEDQEIDLDFDNSDNTCIKTLGLVWQPKKDQFCIKTMLQATNRVTKRIITSEVAKIFDPLGILGPVIVSAKIIIQDLWQLQLSWDQAIPIELHSKWITFREDLKALNNFSFDRHVFGQQIASSIQLHAFCDASEKAYGAAIFVRATLKDGRTIVRLLCSKSRVAPLKKQTIPRLELCAALLSATLMKRVKDDLNHKGQTHFWTDSEIVLFWINSSSSSLQTFVANRVRQIQELTIIDQWRHVRSKDNPADALSRGLMPSKLPTNHLWFFGPLFLHGTENKWPTKFIKLNYNPQCPELKQDSSKFTVTVCTKDEVQTTHNVITAAMDSQKNWIYKINHGNSFNTLQRIVGYVLRFTRRIKGVTYHELTLSTQELNDALFTIIKVIQKNDFNDELKDLKKERTVKTQSPLAAFSPFLDEQGVIRVGGRLEASSLTYDAKHQILVPYNDPFTKLLMEKIHKENMHCGAQALISFTRQKFWPIKAKIMARAIIQRCVKCSKAKPKMYSQIMGNLPADRITPNRPFITTGIDYFGPVWIHYKIRGKRPQKAYVAVFCCFTTKAIHMELVSDLTTDAFIGALKRFIGRRGRCQTIYCDNATNFLGASNQLHELKNVLQSQESNKKITTECNNRGITFKFIPPSSPHFGGLWEAAVKSAKGLLIKILTSASLTYEELETTLVEAEAILNSRPLTPMSNDPNDMVALTPGHFLIGEPLNSSIDPMATPANKSLLTRWKLVTHIKEEFWKRWSLEYLNELQYRHKWKEQCTNAKPGQMVVIKDDNIPSLQWLLGRIEKVYHGQDGAVRVADVRTASGILKRPIHKLAPLPIDSSKDFTQNYHDEISEVNEVPKKRARKTPATTSKATLITFIIALLMLPLALAQNVKIQNFNSDIGIHFEDIGRLKLAASQWDLIVYYDLAPLKTDIIALRNGISFLHHVCDKLNQQCSCNTTLSHFQHMADILQLDNSFFSTGRMKRGAINLVGNFANSLFGVLDSDYAEKMSHTIKEVKDNEDYLLTLLKNKTSVIDSTLNLIKLNRNATKVKFEQVENQLNTITKTIESIEHSEYQFLLFQTLTSLSDQLLLIIINIQRVQTALLDVLTDTHHGKISPALLSVKQLRNELRNIKAHMPANLDVPVDDGNAIQLYKIMTVKGGVTNDHVVFQISLPLTIQEEFDILKIIPIPTIINNTLITIAPCAETVAIDKHRYQFIPLSRDDIKSCLTIGKDEVVCPTRPRYHKESQVCSCEIGLLQNETHASCKLEKIKQNSTWIQTEQQNQWIYGLKFPIRLTIVCDQDSQQVSLEGSGILTIAPQCIAKNNILTLDGFHTISSTIRTSYTAFGRIQTLTTPDQVQEVLKNLSTNHYDDQIKNLTDLQKLLRTADLIMLPHQIKHQNTRNITIASAALFLAVIIIVFIAWNHTVKRCKTTTTKPTPKPRSTLQQKADFTINLDDSC